MQNSLGTCTLASILCAEDELAGGQRCGGDGEQAGGDDVLLAPPERRPRAGALDAGALGPRHPVLRLLGQVERGALHAQLLYGARQRARVAAFPAQPRRGAPVGADPQLHGRGEREGGRQG